MTMTLKEKIEVMEAFHAGKAIQCRLVNASPDSHWRDVEKPMWNFHASDYRVKPDDKPPTRKDLAMNYDQMIAVLQAAKDGKAIQRLLKVPGSKWEDDPKPPWDCGWDFACYFYRVKPEPRVSHKRSGGCGGWKYILV